MSESSANSLRPPPLMGLTCRFHDQPFILEGKGAKALGCGPGSATGLDDLAPRGAQNTSVPINENRMKALAVQHQLFTAQCGTICAASASPIRVRGAVDDDQVERRGRFSSPGRRADWAETTGRGRRLAFVGPGRGGSLRIQIEDGGLQAPLLSGHVEANNDVVLPAPPF